jgi:hypothetical protein
LQLNVARSQYWPALQSLSMKQPPPGAQTPEAVHAPDWQTLAPVLDVQPACPSAKPHTPLLPHALLTH